jgi:hypothetical protein
VSFGNPDTRRAVAKDAMLKAAELDDSAPRARYPWVRRTEAEEDEAMLRDMGVMRATGMVDAEGNFVDEDEDEPDAIVPDVLLLPEDHNGSEEHGPFVAGSWAGEAMRRSGEVIVEEEPVAYEDEVVWVDEDGNVVDEADLGDYVLDDGYGDLPPAA